MSVWVVWLSRNCSVKNIVSSSGTKSTVEVIPGCRWLKTLVLVRTVSLDERLVQHHPVTNDAATFDWPNSLSTRFSTHEVKMSTCFAVVDTRWLTSAKKKQSGSEATSSSDRPNIWTQTRRHLAFCDVNRKTVLFRILFSDLKITHKQNQ